MPLDWQSRTILTSASGSSRLPTSTAAPGMVSSTNATPSSRMTLSGTKPHERRPLVRPRVLEVLQRFDDLGGHHGGLAGGQGALQRSAVSPSCPVPCPGSRAGRRASWPPDPSQA